LDESERPPFNTLQNHGSVKVPHLLRVDVLTLGTKHFDAVIYGYVENGRLLYVAKTRNGFTPAGAQIVIRLCINRIFRRSGRRSRWRSYGSNG
jgi:hypothetical protein